MSSFQGRLFPSLSSLFNGHSESYNALVLPPLTTLIMTSRDVTALTDVAKFKTEADGSFKRQVSIFRDTISVGGKYEPAPGQCQSSPPWQIADQTSAGRYVLYVSYACRMSSLHRSPILVSGFPSAWAHRTIIVRHLKGLTDFIRERSVSKIRYTRCV